MKRLALLASAAFLYTGIVRGDDTARGDATAPTPESVRLEIEGLRSKDVAWRGIDWKTCLLDGLGESQAKGKPLLLWIFIDRPVDDARC